MSVYFNKWESTNLLGDFVETSRSEDSIEESRKNYNWFFWYPDFSFA